MQFKGEKRKKNLSAQSWAYLTKTNYELSECFKVNASSNVYMEKYYMKLIVVFTLFFSAFSSIGFAQTAGIKGNLNDKTDRKPIVAATVSLLKQLDSSVVATTITNENGEYFITLKGDVIYTIKVVKKGYKTAEEKAELKIGKTDSPSIARGSKKSTRPRAPARIPGGSIGIPACSNLAVQVSSRSTSKQR